MSKDVLGLLLDKDIFTTETGVNIEDYLVHSIRNVGEEVTIESGFITSVKEFFLNILKKIKDTLGFTLKDEDVKQKYYIDKMNSLRDVSKTIAALGSRKFSEIEDIELPIMMGMKVDYRTTVFELSNIITAMKEVVPAIDEFNILLSKLVGNYGGIRLSSDPKIFNKTQSLIKVSDKLTRILGELTEVKKPKDIKPAKEIFNNITGIKDIRDSYIKVYKDTLDFDLEKYKNSVNAMSELLDGWIATLHGDSKEIKSSTNIVQIVKTNTRLFADITTSLGIYLLYLNQTSAFFMSDIKILNGEMK